MPASTIELNAYRQRMRVAMLKGYPRTAVVAASRLAESAQSTDRQRAAAARILRLPDAGAFVGGHVPEEIRERAVRLLEAEPQVRLRRIYANMRQALSAGVPRRAISHAVTLLEDSDVSAAHRSAAAEVLGVDLQHFPHGCQVPETVKASALEALNGRPEFRARLAAARLRTANLGGASSAARRHAQELLESPYASGEHRRLALRTLGLRDDRDGGTSLNGSPPRSR